MNTDKPTTTASAPETRTKAFVIREVTDDELTACGHPQPRTIPAEKPTDHVRNLLEYYSPSPEKPTNYGGGYAPTAQDHIRDLHDAATRFEDRAKRAEAQAAQLAECLRDLLPYAEGFKSSAGPIERANEALAAYEAAR